MRLKSELYKDEQDEIIEKLINIIDLEDDNYIILHNLDNNETKKQEILDLIPDIKKYFSFTSSNKPDLLDYCDKIRTQLLDYDHRLHSVDIFDSKNMFNSKIFDSESKMYNYIIVVGKKEIDNNTITFRTINHIRNDMTVSNNDGFEMIKKSYYDKFKI